MNMAELNRHSAAAATERALRLSGGSPSCSYKRLSTAAVRRLQRNASQYTAKEWADELGSSANTIRHRCKALGVSLKPFVR
jgi:hypothetical protein